MSQSTTERVPSERVGSRWLHNPPSGFDFARWFEANVKLHRGLEHGDYVNGITLIPNKERVEVTVDQGNGPEIVEQRRLVFSPYPQVETRVRYFWDLCAERLALGEIKILGVTTQNIKSGDGRTSYLWVSAKAQVRMFERDVRSGDRGRLILDAPVATKTVPVFTKFGPDVNAAMKAETGAIGRALGFAGMLVIPGAGISTAEDMVDLADAQPAAGGEAAPALPEPASADPLAPAATPSDADALRTLVKQFIGELRDNYPTAWEEMEAWAKERGGIDLADPAPATLRPLERQLRRKLEAARKAEARAA